MARRGGDDGHESVMFESVGIGPSGGQPVEYVPVDVDAVPDTPRGEHRRRGVALGVAAIVLIAAVVWVTTRSSTPVTTDGWLPRLPNDPSEAFVWTGPSDDETTFTVAGSATNPLVLTVSPAFGTVYSLDESGDERWRADIGPGIYGEAYRSGDTIVTVTQRADPAASGISADGVAITGLSADNGEQRWQTSAPGNNWALLDDRIVIIEFPTEYYFDDGELTSPGVASATSVDVNSGHEVAAEQYDELFLDAVTSNGSKPGLLAKRDDELFRVDGALNATSSPVAAGDGTAAAGPDDFLVVGGDTVTVYDADGAEVRSAHPLPQGFDGIDNWTIAGAGSDLWLYTTSISKIDADFYDSPQCGVFRFADGDDAPVDLWRSDDCYLSGTLDSASDGEPKRPLYGLRLSGLGRGPRPEQLVDLRSGDPVGAGRLVEIGTNGFVVFDGKQIVGIELDPEPSSRPLFELAVDSEEWQLIDGAIAVVQPGGDGGARSVTLYR